MSNIFDGDILKELEVKILGTLKNYAKKAIFSIDGVNCVVSSYKNENFIARFFLSFTKGLDGDEIVISVDIRKSGPGVTISSDIAQEDGLIIAVGPECVGMLSANLIACWETDFFTFLNDSSEAVKIKLLQLPNLDIG